LTAVERSFPETGPVLRPIDLAVASGELVALLGPSGCGKSTLLRLLAGLDAPDGGSIAIQEHGQRFYRSFVFQDATLIPWRSVLSNVALPLELTGRPVAEARERALAALRRVGLADAAARRPGQLSGGMRMRVSVARALVTEPTLLLLDEPFAALDEQARHGLQDELHRLWRALGMTIVFVTHSVAEAAYLATRTIVLSPRPARVLLDRRSELGEERGLAVRTDARYMREMQAIYAALEGAHA
jgi:NitT/TauT family transport system ATP-binding protein